MSTTYDQERLEESQQLNDDLRQLVRDSKIQALTGALPDMQTGIVAMMNRLHGGV
jgi:hypothetical protein